MAVPGKGETFDDYNFYQSSARMTVECAFGMLIRKWGLLWRPLEMKFSRRVPSISACMHLHNFCIDRRVLEATTHTRTRTRTTGKRRGHTVVEAQVGYGRNSRWERYPTFNKDGVPVDYLTEGKEFQPLDGGTSAGHSLRTALASNLATRDLHRPKKRKTK